MFQSGPGPSGVKNAKVKLKIFILDDHDFFLNIVETHLKKIEKYLNDKGKGVELQITKYNDGLVLIENIKFKPDILIIDYYLNEVNPEAINGDEVFKRVLQKDPRQKVVMLSGQEEARIVHALIRMGLRDYVMKDEEMHHNLQHIIEDLYDFKILREV